MTDALYMDDSYLKEAEGKVMSVKDGKYVILDKTIFFPKGGGVDNDTGSLIRKSDNKVFDVIFTGKFDGNISHEVSPQGLKEEDEVICRLDWERRYLLMRYHTAAHVLSGVFNREYGLMITGNQLTIEKGRIDFDMETMDHGLIEEAFIKANSIIAKDFPVEVYYLPREEALADPNMVKLAKAMPPDVDKIRVVDIKGFDYQADGGCHVKSLKEIGKINLTEIKNKGKDNRRVYFSLS